MVSVLGQWSYIILSADDNLTNIISDNSLLGTINAQSAFFLWISPYSQNHACVTFCSRTQDTPVKEFVSCPPLIHQSTQQPCYDFCSSYQWNQQPCCNPCSLGFILGVGKNFNRIGAIITPMICYIHGLVSDCGLSSALALEIPQSCTRPLICDSKQSLKM